MGDTVPAEVEAAAHAALRLLLEARERTDGGCLCRTTVGWCPTCGPHDVINVLRFALRVP